MRNKCVYSYRIKTPASGFDELLESIFCILLVVEPLFLQKSGQDAWRSGSWLARGQVFMVDEANLSPICSTFEALVVWCAVRHCCGEELGSFCWWTLAAGTEVFGASHEFAECISQMCNCFIRIQKAVVDQMGNRPLNSDHDLFLVQVWLWEVFSSFFSDQPLTWSLLVVIKSTFLQTSHNSVKKWFIVVAQNKRGWHLKMMIFLIFCQLMRHPLIKLLHLSNMLQMPNDLRIINIEFFSNFLCSYKRINFNDCT